MPVFAKTKLVIEDTCFPPKIRIDLEYSGPNPEKIYPKVIEILKTKLGIIDANIQEKEYSWDRSKIPEKFRASVEAIKEFDKFSYMFLSIKIEGEVKPSKDFEKEGKARFSVEGFVRTEYPQDSIWEKTIIYEFLRTVYHKLFYQKYFEKYKEECRKAMLTLQNELKAFFEILPR